MTLRVGVVGTGFGATVHIPAFRDEGADVVLCARDPERTRATADRLGIEEICTSYEELLSLPGIDAVSIASPAPLHAEMAIAALRAGKHVLVEKPFARSSDEARTMVAAADESGCTAMVAHEFRYSSARRRTAELIAEGFIGAPRFALARMITGPKAARKGPAVEYRAEDDSAATGAGLLFRLGSHYIDGLRAWFGEVAAVSGDLRTIDPDRRLGGASTSADADDTFLFTLEFANGCLAQMVGTRHAPFGAEFGIEVYGSEGMLSTPQRGINPPAHGELWGARLGDAEMARLAIPERLEPFLDERDERLMPFRLLVQDFFSGIDDGSSPAPNFADGLRTQLVLDAVRAAASSHRRVEVVPA